MTDQQKEWVKQLLKDSNIAEQKTPRVQILIYWEFDPRDYGGGDDDMNSVDLNWLKKSLNEATIEKCGSEMDWSEVQIGKLQYNASLYWIKAWAWVENPFL